MHGRRQALALIASVVAAACGSRRPPPAESPASPRLKLEPIVDLVPAAGLSWLLQCRPRQLAASPALIPAIAAVISEERFAAFARGHGGVDLREIDDLAIAGFPEATLALARTLVSEARLEASFAERASSVDGRAIEGDVTRFWGTVGREREQIAVLGREGVALERGRLGPLRAALYFAEGKLRRALPALRAEPLARAAALLDGDHPAPVRGFAPGPFEGDWAAGLGGLLRAATAVAVSATPVEEPSGPTARSILRVRVVVTGAWGEQAAAAAERLGAAFGVFASDPLGRLLGLDHPLEGPTLSGEADALHLELGLDPLPIGRGLNAATGASVAEILAF
jgi:hypothetical protein